MRFSEAILILFVMLNNGKRHFVIKMHEIHSGSDSMTSLALKVHRWVSTCCLHLAGPSVAQLGEPPQ